MVEAVGKRILALPLALALLVFNQDRKFRHGPPKERGLEKAGAR
jgi:hypothetical protein